MSTNLDITYIGNKLRKSLGADKTYILKKEATTDLTRLQNLFSFLKRVLIKEGSVSAGATSVRC